MRLITFAFLFLAAPALAQSSPQIYVIEHAPTGDIAREYEGMDLATVENLVSASGNPFDVVDQATYAAKMSALQPKK